MESGAIFSAVKFVCDELNTELRRTYSDNQDRALVGRVRETDGAISPCVVNKTVITLINIEQTTVQGRAPVSVSMGDRSGVVRSAPIHLNLFILVAASFTSYSEALKNLSLCAAFFQSRQDISRDSPVSLPVGISKLDMQLENLSLHELSNVWGMLGGKHYPSLYYKLRMITLDSEHIVRQTPAISEPDVGVGT